MRNNLVFIFIIAIALLFHLLSSNIPDPDSFYHIRHAWVYRTTSLFDSSFPWVYFSAIRTWASDLWYGFHILLVPFTYLNVISGIRIAGFALTATLLAVFYFVVSRHRIENEKFWPFFYFLAVPNVLFWFLAVRPHVLSLIFSLLLLSFSVKNKKWGVAVASFAITFFHLGLFWIVPMMVGAVIAVQIAERFFIPTSQSSFRVSWNLIGWAGIGMIAGWLLRPNPIGAAQLAYIQIFRLLTEKSSNAPLIFGKELLPIGFGELLTTATIFLVFWVLAIGLVARDLADIRTRAQKIPYEERILLWSATILSLVFFLMTLLVARRSMLQWVTFGSLLIPLAYTYLLSKNSQRDASMALMIMLFVMFPYAIYRHGLNMKYVAFEPKEFIEVAEWLDRNSEKGDIVFHPHWDNFPSLFLWNQKNYYINGMDPIFQYEYDKELYWKFYYLSRDALTHQTCGSYPCLTSELEDTYEVLVRDFDAKYIVAEDWRNPKFFKYLEIDPRYEKTFVGPYESVFRIKR